METIELLERLFDEGYLEFPKGNEETELAHEFIRPSKKAKEIGKRIRMRVLLSHGWVEINSKEKSTLEKIKQIPPEFVADRIDRLEAKTKE